MDDKGQLMGVPIKLVMALVIGTMTMGVLMQFVGTAERNVLKDIPSEEIFIFDNPNFTWGQLCSQTARISLGDA